MVSTIKNLYLLRCGFEYRQGTSWRSMWNSSGEHAANQAWAQNREGIKRAFIEIKNLQTKELILAAECPGWDFCNFQWAAMVGVTGSNLNRPLKATNVGLVMRTREQILSVFVDGSHRIDPRSETDKSINFATYGR